MVSMSGIKVCVNFGKATVIRMKNELAMARCPEVVNEVVRGFRYVCGLGSFRSACVQ